MRSRRYLALSCFLLGGLFDPHSVAGGGGSTPFGEPLTPGLETIEIELIVSDPEAWAGRTVRVEGKVDQVCAMQGCWMDLVSSDQVALRVKVDDGVIVFPPEAIGHRATAEGEIEIIEMSREPYVAWKRHAADEEGRAFDPADVGDGPYRVVQLRGFGTEIELP